MMCHQGWVWFGVLFARARKLQWMSPACPTHMQLPLASPLSLQLLRGPLACLRVLAPMSRRVTVLSFLTSPLCSVVEQVTMGPAAAKVRPTTNI